MNDKSELAKRVVDSMMSKDEFSRWLGIEILEVNPRNVTIRMTVRKEMVNGFGVAHGGIVYSFADSALAFASNTSGEVKVSIDNSISYPIPVRVGDVLTATANELSSGNKIGNYEVTVLNQEQLKVGLFRGTVYTTSKAHF